MRRRTDERAIKSRSCFDRPVAAQHQRAGAKDRTLPDLRGATRTPAAVTGPARIVRSDSYFGSISSHLSVCDALVDHRDISAVHRFEYRKFRILRFPVVKLTSC